VDGTNFPQVPFDIGESYSGLLPNTPHGNTSLFFWFFPSTNPAAKKEVGHSSKFCQTQSNYPKDYHLA
jgi:carboxypeptidase D